MAPVPDVRICTVGVLSDRVPDPVMGLGLADRPPPAATDVTVPVPEAVIQLGLAAGPPEDSNCPEVPGPRATHALAFRYSTEPCVLLNAVSSMEVIVVAPVPPFPTGRVPVTSAVRETVLQVAPPAAESARTNWFVQVAPPYAVGALAPLPSTSPVIATVEGAAPAPPPIMKALAVSSAEDAMVVVLLKYGTPPEVPPVSPVPPWVTAAVPVTAEKGGVIVA